VPAGPDDRAEEIAARFPDLTLRTEPAHQEAYVHLPSAQVGEAESILVLETVAAWATEHRRQPAEGFRIVLVAKPASDGGGPACDFAVPLRGAA
jgi:hypothetical protein